jgi:hypothetical protein
MSMPRGKSARFSSRAQEGVRQAEGRDFGDALDAGAHQRQPASALEIGSSMTTSSSGRDIPACPLQTGRMRKAWHRLSMKAKRASAFSGDRRAGVEAEPLRHGRFRKARDSQTGVSWSQSVSAIAPAAMPSGSRRRDVRGDGLDRARAGHASIIILKTLWAWNTGSAKPPVRASVLSHQSSPRTMVKKSTRVAAVSSALRRSAPAMRAAIGASNVCSTKS